MTKIKPIFFANQQRLRNWFEKNHKKEKELFIGFYKVSSSKPSITWSQSVDEALCFGWIDSIRRSIDRESYCIRFTPRKPKSNWSIVNIKKAKKLTKLGLMKPEGLKSFKLYADKRSNLYSSENPDIEFNKIYEKIFKANKKAWKLFKSMPASYQKTTTRWVLSAKQEATKLKRLNELIINSAAGKKIKAMNYGKKKF